MLEDTDAEFLLHMQVRCHRHVIKAKLLTHHVQHQPQQLLLHAIAHIKASEAPTDENALDVRLSNPYLISLPIYDLDFDSVFRRDSSEEVHEPQLRHHRSISGIRQR